jgi:hypothetical protein
MSDYFLLEVLAHELQLVGAGSATSLAVPGTAALAFQFLDYPLLLCYASQETSNASGQGHAAAALSFGAGKSCIFQEDADELRYVLEKVWRACGGALLHPWP